MNLVIATLPLSDVALQSTREPQPHLCVLVQSPEFGAVLYSGLWVHYQLGERRICWLADPGKLKNATVKILGSHFIGSVLHESSNILLEPCLGPAKALVEWLRPPSVPDSPLLARVEVKEASRAVIPLRDDMWARVEAGENPVVVSRRDCYSLAVGFKNRAKQMLELCFSTPIAVSGVRLQLSRTRRVLTLIVPRAAYAFISVAPSEICLDDFKAWSVVNLPNDYMLSKSRIARGLVNAVLCCWLLVYWRCADCFAITLSI